MFIPKNIVKEGTLLNFYPGGVYDFAGMLKSRNGYQNPNVQCSIPKCQFSRQENYLISVFVERLQNFESLNSRKR